MISMSDIREDITLVTTNVGLIMSKGIAEINKTFNEGKTWVVVSTLHYQTTDSLPSSFSLSFDLLSANKRPYSYHSTMRQTASRNNARVL